jgi:hypothetical protein
MTSNVNYETTNYSYRNIDEQFDLKKFNYQFEENDLKLEEQLNNNMDMKNDEIIKNTLPHQRSMEDIIINIREMFYKSLEMLIDKQNPIPYLMSTPDRQFSVAIFLIVIGSLFMLFANLMISTDEK